MRPNQQTLDLYNEVLENVISSVGDEWRESGGDFSILQNIKELWVYRTLKKCNIECVEPQSQPLKRAKQKQEAKNDDLFKFFSAGYQQPKDGMKDASDSSEESSSSQKSSSDSSSDLGDSGSGSDKSSGDDSEDSQSDDGLGDDTDDEVNNMVTPIKARDILFCEYTYESKKRKKQTRGFTLNVVNCHFTIDGIPRVVKNGTINFT